MTLEEFRIEVLKTLQTCPIPGDARVLLTEAYLVLMDRRFNDSLRRMFWGALHADIEQLTRDLNSCATPAPPDAPTGEAASTDVMAGNSCPRDTSVATASTPPTKANLLGIYAIALTEINRYRHTPPHTAF